MIEVGSVALESAPVVEQLAEAVLYGDDMLANRDLAAELFLEMRRCRKMVGVGMGLQQPVDCKVMLLDEGDDLVGRGKARAPCRRIIIEYAVDDRGALGRGIVDDIGHRVGRIRPEERRLGQGGVRT